MPNLGVLIKLAPFYASIDFEDNNSFGDTV